MKQILFGLVFLHNALECEANVEDDATAIVEAEVDQGESNWPRSPIHHLHRSITNKCSAFGLSSCVASKTTASSLGSKSPSSSLHSFHPPGDELSFPLGDVCSDLESVSPTRGSVGLAYHHADAEFQDHTTLPGLGSPHVSTIPSESVGLPHSHADVEIHDHTTPPGHRTPHVSTSSSCLCFRVSGVSLHMSPQTQLESSNTLVDFHVIDIGLETDAQNGNRPTQDVPPMKLGKTFLGLTYQATLGFLIFHYQAAVDSSSQDHSPKPPYLLLQIAEVNLAVSFTVSLIGILLHQVYPEKSDIILRVGSMSAALGFFIMVSMLLTSISGWVGWICAVGSLLAFVIAFVKRKID